MKQCKWNAEIQMRWTFSRCKATDVYHLITLFGKNSSMSSR
jgi:hypothetical protein